MLLAIILQFRHCDWMLKEILTVFPDRVCGMETRDSRMGYTSMIFLANDEITVRKAPQYGDTSTDHTHSIFPIDSWVITFNGVAGV